MGVHPIQHVSVNPMMMMMYRNSPGENMNYNQTVTNNIIPQKLSHVKKEKDSVVDFNGKNTFSQTDNIRQHNNTCSQTQQHVEFGTKTNSSNHDFSTQTKPLDLSNKNTNTSYFNQMVTQTKPK